MKSLQIIFFILLVLSIFSQCESLFSPEADKYEIGSGVLTDTLKSYYGVWKTVQLPATNNYFEFDITWAHMYAYSEEKSWRLTFKPVSRKIQIIPEDGNKLLAPLEGYSGEEHSFLYRSPSIPRKSEDIATFFYLSSNEILYGRLECKTNYEMITISEREKTIFVRLEYNWIVRTDGERSFPRSHKRGNIPTIHRVPRIPEIPTITGNN